MLKVVGINHKTAPIELREKFFLTDPQTDFFLSELKSNPAVVEAFVLSTCNRTEIYLHLIDHDFKASDYIDLISQVKKNKHTPEDEKSFYVYSDEQMIRHLFCVVAGLDSLVLGEKQILGQVKKAFERSKERKILLRSFNILSNVALRVGKKVRTETSIDYGGSSVSWAAIALAERQLGGFEDKKAVVIGAGEMSKLALSQLSGKKFRKLYLMNRSQDNACRLTDQFGGEAIGFDDIKEVLVDVDLCICAAGAPHHIIEASTIEKVMIKRNHKPLLMIDISMPRNIDPQISQIKNVSLHDIDSLDMVVQQSLKIREQAVGEVKQIIEDKIADYFLRLKKSDIADSSTIAQN